MKTQCSTLILTETSVQLHLSMRVSVPTCDILPLKVSRYNQGFISDLGVALLAHGERKK